MKLFKRSKKRTQLHDEDLYNHIINAFRSVLPADKADIELDRNTIIYELGIDSIKYVNLLIALEDLSGMSLEEVVEKIDLTTIHTIADIEKQILELK